ncbi:MAG: HAD-IIB family hydrolase [Pseudohongiella sp.]|uniref:HAD-IIB family hydrolase n=1 Tax=Pseudohongiella sp. TaxID=1979412 RepID=UPI00349FF98B
MSSATDSIQTQSNTAPELRSIIVVTDLDGTLLDHFSYSAEPALATIRKLQKRRIPLIFNTSKTLSECEALSEKLGLSDPFIVENGSATYYPKRRFRTAPPGGKSHGVYWQVVAGLDYQDIRERLADIKPAYRLSALSDCSLGEICAATGLSMTAARRAKTRQFSEPLIWQDSDAALDAFRQALATKGLSTLRGGRFLHVLGDTDKGRALTAVQAVYAQNAKDVVSIALGDSDNDIAMLQASDFPVLIRSPAHALPELNTNKPVIISDETGPTGWASSIKTLLKTL